MINGKNINKIPSIVKTWGKFSEKKYSLSTDSRNISDNQIFLALKGENFDAFNFVEEVLKSGCKLVIVEHSKEREDKLAELAKSFPSSCIISVVDSLLALQELSEIHVQEWLSLENKHVIGITGSNGKTTHKEMLFHLLSSVFPEKVQFTSGNYNNHIGVPLTLLTIDSSHDFAIVEMGTNHPGEIKRLCEIAHPTSGLITNIGDAHLEFFHTREAIFEEKSSLYDSVVENCKGEGSFVINRDDPLLKNIAPTKGLSTFGEQLGDYLVQPLGRGFYLSTMDNNWEVENPNLYERFNLKNLACCLILAMKLLPEHQEQLISAAESFKLPENNRSQWIESSGKKYFLDAYNANPSSMEASLSAFADYMDDLQDCFFILGDMNELGEKAPELHASIARHLSTLGAKNAAFIGRYSQYYAEGFDGEPYQFENKDSFLKEWESIQNRFNNFFLKGSRTLQLETLIDIT